MAELAQLRDRLRRLRDQATEEKLELLAYRIDLALAEADMSLHAGRKSTGIGSIDQRGACHICVPMPAAVRTTRNTRGAIPAALIASSP